jgi:hypothetical protein
MDILGKVCCFCGAEAARPDDHYNMRTQEWISTTACTNPDCLLYKQEMSIDDWNTLPDIASLLYQRDDARGERNAYMKSYERATKEKDDYFECFLNMTTAASNAAQDRDMYRKKLDIAMDVINKVHDELVSTTGVYYRIRTIDMIEDAFRKIEKIKRSVYVDK